MDAMPAEAGSSDDEGQDKSTRAGNLQPAASDASFTSTSTGVGQTQRFKVGTHILSLLCILTLGSCGCIFQSVGDHVLLDADQKR